MVKGFILSVIQRVVQYVDVVPHHRQVGDALCLLSGGDVVAGVKGHASGSRHLADGISHLMVGQFNCKNDWEMVSFYFMNQKGDGFCAWFAVRGASGERCVILKSELICEVAQWKTVSKQDLFPLGMGDDIFKLLIEPMEFSGIGGGVFPVV